MTVLQFPEFVAGPAVADSDSGSGARGVVQEEDRHDDAPRSRDGVCGGMALHTDEPMPGEAQIKKVLAETKLDNGIDFKVVGLAMEALHRDHFPELVGSMGACVVRWYLDRGGEWWRSLLT